MNDQLTQHARFRAIGRSVRQCDLAFLLEEGDLVTGRPGGADVLRLSQTALREAESLGVPSDKLRRAAALTAVISDGHVLTVYRHTHSRRSLCRSRRR